MIRPASAALLPAAAAVAGVCLLAGCALVPADARIVGDEMPSAWAAGPGDPQRGHQIVVSREANCLLCHSIPDPKQRVMGDLGPPLAGVGARLTPGELRLRVADPTRLNRDAAMPAYHRVLGLNDVAPQYRGKPILDAQQIEDVVAYLGTLR